MLDNQVFTKILADAEFLFAHTECKMSNLANWYSVCYKIPLKDKSLFGGGTDRGLHFCKETNKICKNALFLEFLAYLYFVAW